MTAIGHKRQIDHLTRIAQSGQIPHALLFAGPDHLGKKLIALQFFGLGPHHPDLLVVGREPEKKEIGIGQIRSLKKFVSLSPFEHDRKLVVVDDAHELSAEAANSLLKVFEEPPGATSMVLVTSRPARLPVTIRSRAVRINFYPVARSLLPKSIPPAELDWIAGRPGLALTYLQNSKDRAVAKRQESFRTFNLASTMSAREKIALAEAVAADDDRLEILESWLIAARRKLLNESNPVMLTALKRLKQCRELLASSNVNVRLQLENMLLCYT